MKHSKWLAKLGAIGYDTLILLNAVVNFLYEKLGRGRVSFSKKIKNRVKSAVKFIDDFENTAAEIAISNQYDYVVCGHIHNPEIRTITTEQGQVMYLNSGDWVENLTALEYNHGQWALYRYQDDIFIHEDGDNDSEEENLTATQLYENLVKEFKIKQV